MLKQSLSRAVTWLRQLWQAPEMVPVTQVAAISRKQGAGQHPTKRGSDMVRAMGATRL
jgi:hypothetical protein